MNNQIYNFLSIFLFKQWHCLPHILKYIVMFINKSSLFAKSINFEGQKFCEISTYISLLAACFHIILPSNPWNAVSPNLIAAPPPPPIRDLHLQHRLVRFLAVLHLPPLWNKNPWKSCEFFHGQFTGFLEVFNGIFMAKCKEIFMVSHPEKGMKKALKKPLKSP